jgi:hypothetical protein
MRQYSRSRSSCLDPPGLSHGAGQGAAGRAGGRRHRTKVPAAKEIVSLCEREEQRYPDSAGQTSFFSDKIRKRIFKKPFKRS